ncbi:MAG: hypothetical protein WAO78_14535 [Roseovarius sp.]
MKFLNVRFWLIVFGIFLLIGSLSGIGSVESEASKQWDGVDLTGRTLDIAASVEVVWVLNVALWGAAIIVISLLVSGHSLARVGVVAIVTVLLSQLVVATYLGVTYDYGQSAGGPPWQFFIILALAIVTLVACITNWRQKPLSVDTSASA